MAYAILASSLPQAKLGILMGLFDVFVVLPQLLVAIVMGIGLKAFCPTEPIWTMAFAAGVLALATLRVAEPERIGWAGGYDLPMVSMAHSCLACWTSLSLTRPIRWAMKSMPSINHSANWGCANR